MAISEKRGRLQKGGARRAAVVLVFALGIPGGAEAEGEPSTGPQDRLAVLGLEGRDVPPEQLDRLSEAIVQSLAQVSSYRPVPGKSLEEVKLVFGCMGESSRCMARVGRSLGAPKLMWGTVRRGESGLSLVLKLLDVQSGQLQEGKAHLLNEAESASPLRMVTQAVRSLLRVPPSAIRLTSAVIGAAVHLDGQLVGYTDGSSLVLRDLSPGPHSVSLTKAGLPSWSQSVDLAPGATLELDASLPAAPEASPDPTLGGAVVTDSTPTSSTLGWRIAFWTSLGLTAALGGAVIATGLTVVAAENDKDAALAGLDDIGGSDFDGGELDAMRRQGCDAIVRTDALDAACDKGQRYRKATNILIAPLAGMGALTVLFGSIWLYKSLAHDSERESAAAREDLPTQAQRDKAASWTVLPTAGPNGQGAGLILQF
jgi:TolB-like protein